MITIRDFIPPIARRIRERLRGGPPQRLEDRRFADYESAAAESGEGWNDADLARWVVRDALAVRESASKRPAEVQILELRTIAAIAWVLTQRLDPGRLSVLDFGGSAGHNYFSVKALFPTVPLHWQIVETEAMVLATAALASDELLFGNMIAVTTPDVVFSTGAIQYHPHPLELLRQLTGLKAQYIALFRTAMSDQHDTFCAIQRTTLGQHLRKISVAPDEDFEMLYPVTFVPRDGVRAVLGVDYEIVSEFDEGVMYRVGPAAVHGYGMLCRRRDR